MSEIRDKILREVGYATNPDGEELLGFVGVVITKNPRSGKVLPTLIDCAYGGAAKVNSEELRDKFRELGAVISETIMGLQP